MAYSGVKHRSQILSFFNDFNKKHRVTPKKNGSAKTLEIFVYSGTMRVYQPSVFQEVAKDPANDINYH